MGLESLLQKGKNNIRKALIAGLASSVLFLSCGKDSSTSTSQPNPPGYPQTEISYQFGNDGKITYIFLGTDSDGVINYISVRVNGGVSQNLNDGSSKLIDIIEGTNMVEATAYDNEGLADPTPAEYSFVSLTEEQAIPIISGVLNARASSYNKFERDVLLSLGASEGFYVDYLITKKDSTNAVVNYVGYRKNLTEEFTNQGLLSTFRVPNLYLIRIPETEITSRLNDFIDKGFN